MKLLIVTQKVDRADPILGFFHRWVEEFARHCERVTVIAQTTGEYSLPGNVTVISLGKEQKKPRPFQVKKFKCLIWKHRREYDTVLVHMTPIWVALGMGTWMILRKKIFLWYEAQGGGIALPVSLLFVRKAFSATAHGMPCNTKKSRVVGHGIDLEEFSFSDAAREKLIVSVGRTARSKRFDVVLRAFAELPEEYKLFMAGGPITSDDRQVLSELEALIKELDLTDRVTIRFLKHEEVVTLLRRATLFLHASDTALDKVVLEAMASGCPVVSTAEATKDVLPARCHATDETFADRARNILSLPAGELASLRQDMRNRVERDHGLDRLVRTLVAEMR